MCDKIEELPTDLERAQGRRRIQITGLDGEERAPKTPWDLMPDFPKTALMAVVQDPMTGFQVMIVIEGQVGDLSVHMRVIWLDGLSHINTDNLVRLVTGGIAGTAGGADCHQPWLWLPQRLGSLYGTYGNDLGWWWHRCDSHGNDLHKWSCDRSDDHSSLQWLHIGSDGDFHASFQRHGCCLGFGGAASRD
jgi:hypothetical protein